MWRNVALQCKIRIFIHAKAKASSEFINRCPSLYFYIKCSRHLIFKQGHICVNEAYQLLETDISLRLLSNFLSY